jgi:hypothetical protein
MACRRADRTSRLDVWPPKAKVTRSNRVGCASFFGLTARYLRADKDSSAGSIRASKQSEENSLLSAMQPGAPAHGLPLATRVRKSLIQIKASRPPYAIRNRYVKRASRPSRVPDWTGRRNRTNRNWRYDRGYDERSRVIQL